MSMRVTFRLLAALLICILALLAVDSYLIVRRDVQQFDHDTRRDAIHLGRILAEIVTDAWHDDGETEARELVTRLGRGHETLVVRWAELGASGPDACPPGLAAADSTALVRGESVSFKATAGGERFRHTLIPLTGIATREVVLVISESLREQAEQTRNTIRRSLILGGLVVVVGVVLMVTLGIHMIGRPLQRLVDKTERIGAGDLAGDLVIHGRDEFSDLARSMNRMCEHLATAREEIRQKNEARLAALDQLRHAERLTMLGRLSSGLAHELGTPLNVVSGRAKMIARRELEGADIADSAEIIGTQAERMADLVRRFLEYARRGTCRRAPEDLRALAAHSLKILEQAARKARVELELDAPDDLPEVMVDRVRMEQVLVNLVMNAIQAMPDGGTLRVSVAVEPDQRLALRVIDQGVGIREEILDQVCEPFFTTKQTDQGTGLGLSIVKGIVEDNGGTLDITSEVGRGTTVTVLLARRDEA